MKTVTVVKEDTGYGWYLPKGTYVTCQCIYAKLKGEDIYSSDLERCIWDTFPNNPRKRKMINNMIYNIDKRRGTEKDIVNLKKLADILKMRVVVKK